MNAIERAVDALLELPVLEQLGPDAEATLRRLQVLGQLNGHPLSVRRLAAVTDISKSAAGRHAIALADAGLAERIVGGYTLAAQLAEAIEREEVEARAAAELKDRAAEAQQAPACDCERPIHTIDDDGDPTCGHCGRRIAGVPRGNTKCSGCRHTLARVNGRTHCVNPHCTTGHHPNANLREAVPRGDKGPTRAADQRVAGGARPTQEPQP